MLGHLIPVRLAGDERWSIPTRRPHSLEKALRAIRLPHAQTEAHKSAKDATGHFRFLASLLSRFR
jgi:hypothetical protein